MESVATGIALKMGKVATVGLASTIFGPLQNLTGSYLANWFRKRTTVFEIGDGFETNTIPEFENIIVDK
jgi:hypothetical protein